MKTEDLKALGLTDEQIDKLHEYNGKDLAKANKRIADLEAERDGLNGQIATMSDSLKRFDGIDPDKLHSEITAYREQVDKLKTEHATAMTKRDQRDWMSKQLDRYGVKSQYARKQLLADASEGLTWKDGAFEGFDDFMKKAHDNDATLYVSDEQKQAEAEAAKAAEQDAKKPRIMGATGSAAGEEKPAATVKRFF